TAGRGQRHHRRHRPCADRRGDLAGVRMDRGGLRLRGSGRGGPASGPGAGAVHDGVGLLVLGIGLPTTANYVITATLAAPAIVMVLEGEFETRTLSMLLMAHMFVYYYGVLADITPPVCLACYAAAGISGGDPIR